MAEIKKIVPTEEQAKAIQYCLDYIDGKVSDNGKGYIFISGQAGVGKSEIQKFVLNNFRKNQFKLAAYTAKAARVMEDKSGYPASTIHRLMYKPILDRDGNILDWVFDRDILRDDRNLKFVLIDECSMMSQRQLDDLISSGKKIIVFGDYYQLPPINAPQIFTKQNADIVLTKIHRQAEGNPLIQYLTKLRKGEDIDNCNIDNKLIKSNDINEVFGGDIKKFLDYDQIICGTNATRKALNAMIRKEIKGIDSPFPVAGERLICLKNNYNVDLANGDQFEINCDAFNYRKDRGTFCVKRDIEPFKNKKREIVKERIMVCMSDNYDDIIRHRMPEYLARGKDRSNPDILIQGKHLIESDYSYVISCHKAQGSEWKNVLVIDESDVFRDTKYRWLYTAVSRGKESVTIISL